MELGGRMGSGGVGETQTKSKNITKVKKTLYGVDATIIIFVFLLYCIVLKIE